MEFRKQYQIENTKRFTGLENRSDDEDISGSWESIKKTIKSSAKGSLGLHEMKQHKPWFDEKYLGIYTRGYRQNCS
jgi:hypothetical protein